MNDRDIIKDNPFDGKGMRHAFARLIYKRIKTRQWFTYTNVMEDKIGKGLGTSVSKCDGYNELRKASMDVFKLIRERAGADCIEEEGNNRDKHFRYTGEDDDPLEIFISNSVIKDIRVYAQFCEDSAGLLPRVWLDYFLEGTIDLLKIKRRRTGSDQIISSSADRELKNIEWLPQLYEHIRDKQALWVVYKPYLKDEIHMTFHPHMLKEYNGRWFVLGHAEDIDPAPDNQIPEFGYNIPLDRIDSFDIAKGVAYVAAPEGFYADYLRDIVGVTKYAGLHAAEIVLRATDKKTFKYVETKKIHHSQETVKEFGKHDDGEYGEFRLTVVPNDEFYGRVLQWGAGLVVTSPESVREEIRSRVKRMTRNYES